MAAGIDEIGISLPSIERETAWNSRPMGYLRFVYRNTIYPRTNGQYITPTGPNEGIGEPKARRPKGTVLEWRDGVED